MAGGIIQLIAYGMEDIYLTGNPQITFFKVVYRRYSNFSIQTFEKTFNDSPNFGKKSSVQLFRLGDLVTKMHLRVIINKIMGCKGIKFAWVRRLGHAMLDYYEIIIGGYLIDKQYGLWLDIWFELARSGEHERGYAKVIGEVDELTEFNDLDKPQYTLYIPFLFWFNRNVGLALPLISIHYQDIFINVKFEEREKLIIRNPNFSNFDDVKILEVGLVTDYIFLDIEERRRFATVSHEYLIEQVQFSEEGNINECKNRISIGFNFPTKELIWVTRNEYYTSGRKFLCYSNRNNWNEEIIKFSYQLLQQSMLLLKCEKVKIDCCGNVIIKKPKELPPASGYWEEFKPSTFNKLSENFNLEVSNLSNKFSLWINTQSLLIDNFNFMDKINATITINPNNEIIIEDLLTHITEIDLSFPVDLMIDTRIGLNNDVCVYQFSNYGLFINGECNPLTYAMLEFNDLVRIEKRDNFFFGILQPYMHHSSTPKDGINLYSFALEPEKYQPTGTCNLSKIENVILTLWFDKIIYANDIYPSQNPFGKDSKLFVFAYSYNILRIVSGLVGLVYTN